jgi:hypothetical protein
MLLSYFDDSSDPQHKEYFAVGGLIGGEKQWADFYTPWAVATIKLKEPFRSTECECQQGQFKDWSVEDCNKLMADLVSVVLSQQLHGYASVVPISDYKAVFPGCGEYEPYYLAVRHTLINMAHIGRKAQGYDIFGGMECWFEDSDATSGTACRIYRELKALKTWPDASSLKGFHLDDKTLRPLQAADLVAREAFKHFKNLGAIQTRIPVDRMRNLLSFCTWDRATLEYLRDNGGPNDLELLTSWGEWKARNRPQPPTFKTFWRNFGARVK